MPIFKKEEPHTKDKKSSGFQSAVSLFGQPRPSLSTLLEWSGEKGDEARKVPRTTTLGTSGAVES